MLSKVQDIKLSSLLPVEHRSHEALTKLLENKVLVDHTPHCMC